jgi:thioester reductase-like protein
LVYTNEYIARVYNAQTLVPPSGFESVNKKLQSGSCLVTLPPFHIAGLAFTLLFPAFYHSIPVYPTVGTPPGVDVFLGALGVTPNPIDWAFVSPVVVDEIGKDPRVLQTLKNSKLKHLFFTGGSVPHESGTAVAREVDLNQVLGSSECAAFPLLLEKGVDRAENWNYVHIHPEANVKFRPQYGEFFEMVQVRGKEEYQPVFCHFNELQEYETKDLFKEHPTLLDTYIHVGRTDDVIVFLNGEKTNPVTFEERVARHPEVRAALVIGHQREEAALLVEPVNGQMLLEADRLALVGRIWPIVDECNSVCPRHARVSKAKILVAPADMAFIRAGKGTVQRRSTLAKFEAAIDLLYGQDAELNVAPNVDIVPGPLLIEKVTDVVGRLVNSKCSTSSPTSDFFSEGMMDSLQAIWLRQELKRAFPSVSTTMEMIYTNPTTRSLATSIMQAFSGNIDENRQTDELSHMLQGYLFAIDALLDDEIVMPNIATCDLSEEMVDCTEYTASPAPRSIQHRLNTSAKGAILLTGSTGALGSHILNTLLDREQCQIYCLNRSVDSRRLQIGRNKIGGLPVVFPEGRVQFLTGNPALPNFGLDGQTYEDLLGSVTHVIHNAWPVDFNMSLQSFTACLDGVLGLISFAHRSQSRVTLQFVSSIAAVAGSPCRSLIAEDAATQKQAPISMGYGQSKYLAERMVTHASQVLGIKTIVARVGQVSGDASRKRGWNRREWFPSLVVSSLYIRALPNTLGCAESGKEVAWIPVDATARIIQELSVSSLSPGENVTFHVVHPRPAAWAELLPIISDALNRAATKQGGPQVELVDYDEWFNKLQATFDADVVDAEALSANPAVKLLPFFESLLSREDFTGNFDVSRSEASSKTMQSLESVSADCLQAWTNGWIHERH